MFFFLQTVLADRYFHRQGMLVKSLKKQRRIRN